MGRLLLRALAVHLCAGRSLFLLTVFGVALGVAAVLAIQIINRNALAAFEGGMAAVSGDADLTVFGRAPSLPDSLLPVALAQQGVEAAWPLVRLPAAVIDTESSLQSRAGFSKMDALFLDVVGVDLFTPVSIPWDGDPGDIADALAVPGWAAFTPSLARQQGWQIGDKVRVWVGSREIALTVGALVDFQELTPLASPKLVVVDIAQAQSMLGQRAAIHQIDVRLRDGVNASVASEQLQTALGSGARVVTPEQRRTQTQGLLSAFRLNLTALSLISLVVGLFLVYSATQASLVRRRSEFGTLRSLGATRGQILTLILSEVALLGALGVLVGLPLGYWAAQANISVVSTALTNLYLLEEISSLRVPPSLIGIAAAIGIGGALVGALAPAIDMSRRDTRALLSAFTLHERIHSLAPKFGLLGLGILGAAGVWFAAGGHRWQHAGFVLAVALLAGVPLLTPWTIRFLTRPLRVRGFGPVYSLKSLGTRLQSSAFAVAALGVAVTMLVGITVMVGSFRDTLTVWIETTVQADVYVSPAAWRGPGEEAFLDEALATTLAGFPGVRAVDRMRSFLADTAENDAVLVIGVDVGLPVSASRFTLLEGDPTGAFLAVHEREHVLVGETLARRRDLWVGDTVSLHTADGLRAFPIAGVYYDYDARGGGVLMDLETLGTHWGRDGLNGIALYLDDGLDADRVIDELRATLNVRALDLLSNRRLREQAINIFEQTFAITRLLQGISLLIAASGITLMLLVTAREQISELALYRAIGATRRQVFGLFVGKGLGMGGLGLILGGAGGILLALILILVINRAYFGWTIQLHWPWVAFGEQAATILLAAVAASLYPAWKASRTSAAELRREDV